MLDIGEYESVTFDILLDGEYAPELVYIGINNTNPVDIPFTLGKSFEISGNTFTSNNGRGIWLENSAIKISFNDFEFSNNGVRSMDSSPSIFKNRIINNGYGINLYHSTPNISNNEFVNNTVGVYCRESSIPNLDTNEIFSNEYGIICHGNSNATINNNDIIGNNQVGILINQSSPLIKNNLITSSKTYLSSGNSGDILMSEKLGDSFYAQVKQNSMVLMKSGSFSTIGAEMEKGNKQVNTYILQFKDTPLQSMVEECKNIGATFYDYMPNNAYIVRMDNNTRDSIMQLDYIRWIGHYKTKYKISSQLAKKDGVDNVTIILLDIPNISTSIGQIIDQCEKVHYSYKLGYYININAKIDVSNLPTIADIDGVYWIESSSSAELTDEVSCEIVGGDGNLLFPTKDLDLM